MCDTWIYVTYRICVIHGSVFAEDHRYVFAENHEYIKL